MKKGTCRSHTSRMRAVRVRPVQACPRAALPSGPAGQKSSSRSKVPLLLVTGSSAGSRTVGPCHGRRPTARSVFFCGPGQWRGASGNGARRELRSLRPTSLSQIPHPVRGGGHVFSPMIVEPSEAPARTPVKMLDHDGLRPQSLFSSFPAEPTYGFGF